MFRLMCCALPFAALCAACQSSTVVRVLTQHNDNARTGANLDERILTTGNVRPGKFGLLFSRVVDGQIYAQPLYVPGVVFPDHSVHNVIYVATMHNTVYAFNADDGAAELPLWKAHLGEPLDFDFFPMKWWIFGKYTIWPEIGITSTPVIDLQTSTLYIAAKVRKRSSRFRRGEYVSYHLHAIDLVTGRDRPGSPVEVEARVRGFGKGSKDGFIQFDPVRQLQRPGLLLAGRTVYLAFGSHQDTEPYHGWILAYDAATLKQTGTYCTSCSTARAGEGAIWQSGNGPAADDQGNVYVMTGNGARDDRAQDFGSSFLKLSPGLSLLGWFKPSNYRCLNHVDADLGSAGPVLIPGTNLLIGGGKEGVIFVLDRGHLGGLQPSGNEPATEPCTGEMKGSRPPPLYSFQATPLWEDPGKHKLLEHLIDDLFPNKKSWGYHHIHGSPVFWNSRLGPLVYVWGERDYLRAFRLDVGAATFPETSPPGQSPRATYRTTSLHGKGMPGAALSLSANGSLPGTAIVWASLPLAEDAFTDVVPGVLRAFAAVPNDPASGTLEELWNSTLDPTDDVVLFAKFCPPTIANGKVYLATFSRKLNVYGLREKSDVSGVSEPIGWTWNGP